MARLTKNGSQQLKHIMKFHIGIQAFLQMNLNVGMCHAVNLGTTNFIKNISSASQNHSLITHLLQIFGYNIQVK